MKKTILYTENVVRKRSVFNCFHFIVGSFLGIIPNLSGVSVLQCGIWNHVEFLYSFYIKFTSLSCSWINLLPMLWHHPWFDYLKNTRCSELHKYTKYWHIPLDIIKNHIGYFTDLIRKVFSGWEDVSWQRNKVLPLENSHFILAANCCFPQ